MGVTSMRLFLNRLMILSAIGLLNLGCPEAWGADWMFYGGTDQYSCFYDRGSIGHPSENIVEVLEKQNYTRKGVNFMVGELGKKYEHLSHSITVWQINCADKKFRFLSLIHYSKEGKAIYSWKVLYSSLPSEEWSPFITGSLGERLSRAVCK
jgi:Surface-adhesin protein E